MFKFLTNVLYDTPSSYFSYKVNGNDLVSVIVANDNTLNVFEFKKDINRYVIIHNEYSLSGIKFKGTNIIDYQPVEDWETFWNEVFDELNGEIDKKSNDNGYEVYEIIW